MTRELKYVMDEIPFKLKFKHASFEREASSTLWVSLKSNLAVGLGESCPRDYVTGETPESIQSFFADPKVQQFADTLGFEEFESLIKQERVWIDKNPSAFCALELAWWDLFAKSKDVSVDKVFGDLTAERKAPHTMVIGLSTHRKMLKTYLRGIAFGFRDFKIKIAPEAKKELAMFLLEPIFKATKILKPTLRFDANNSFTNYRDLQNLLDLVGDPTWAIEEPFSVKNIEAREEFLKKSNNVLILDESFVKLSDLRAYGHVHRKICLNIRISKLGGLFRTQEIINYAEANGIRWGLGCQVGETTLLTRAGLCLLEKSHHHPLFWEGAFSDHLLSQDPFSPKLKVGAFGRIRGRRHIQGSGWGVIPKSEYFKKIGVLS
jgi:L-alanine-DL-glutamate epimerase-like enolase superfamily enzyme